MSRLNIKHCLHRGFMDEIFSILVILKVNEYMKDSFNESPLN